MPSMIILYLVHSNINLYYRLHYPVHIPCLRMKMDCNMELGEKAKFSELVGFTSKSESNAMCVCVSGGRYPGGGEKFTESARHVTTQQSDLKSASCA